MNTKRKTLAQSARGGVRTRTFLAEKGGLSPRFCVRMLRFRPDVHVPYGLAVRSVQPIPTIPAAVGKSCEHLGIIRIARSRERGRAAHRRVLRPYPPGVSRKRVVTWCSSNELTPRIRDLGREPYPTVRRDRWATMTDLCSWRRLSASPIGVDGGRAGAPWWS